MTGADNADPTVAARRDLAGIGLIGVLTYFILVGDLTWREIQPFGLIVQSLMAAGLVLLYVHQAPRSADRLDSLLLLALLLFAVPGVFSQFPRQSFDSVLVVLLYVAGLFLAREVMARPGGRSLFVVAMLAVSVTVTAITAVSWLGMYLRWWALTDWAIVPPLGMVLPSGQWGHRHDLALLVALLYPAWWIGRISVARLVAAIAVGAVDLALIVIGGSRTVWIALLLASVLIGIPWFARRIQLNRAIVVSAAGALLVAVVGAATGLMGPVLERMVGSASLAERTAMWGPLVEAWTSSPLVGHGPGSFVWVLEGSGYFDTSSLAPRHPDSAVIQLLAEGGLIGLLGLAVAACAVGVSVYRGQSSAAIWAIAGFAVAALGGNPTDFGFIVAVCVGWVAFAAPRQTTLASRSPRTVLRIPSFAALGIIGLAFASTIAGFIAYSSARDAIQAERLSEAEAPLRMAVLLDPGLGIYHRQLGALALASGDSQAAVATLERASALNPNDDLAWRTLALAYVGIGNDAAAWGAIERALALQRSNTTNLLMAAVDRKRTRDLAASAALLGEVAQSWPEVVATEEWSDIVSGVSNPSEILARARNRWELGDPSPEPLVAQPLLLAVMTGRGAVIDSQATRYSRNVAAAYLAVARCAPSAAEELRTIADQERRQPAFWMLTIRLHALQGSRDARSITIFTMTTGDPVLETGQLGALNPLNENGRSGSSYDRWGYRRPGIVWPSSRWQLPSPRAGFARWYLAPVEASRIAGLTSVLPRCV